MIRRLSADDLEAFRATRLRALELHPEGFGTDAGAWRRGTQTQVAAALGGSDGMFYLGGFADSGPRTGELVGLASFRRERRPAIAHKGSVRGVFVAPEHRATGMGRRLVDALLSEVAGFDGLEYVRAVVTATSEPAMRTFLGAGFVEYGREPGGIRAAGEAHDQAFLRRTLP